MKKVAIFICVVLLVVSVIPLSASAVVDTTTIPDCLTVDLLPTYLQGYFTDPVKNNDTFVMLRLTQTTWQIWISYQCSFYTNSYTNQIGFGIASTSEWETYGFESAVYTATYDYEGNITSDWQNLSFYSGFAGISATTCGRFMQTTMSFTSSNYLLLSGHSCPTRGVSAYTSGKSLFAVGGYQTTTFPGTNGTSQVKLYGAYTAEQIKQELISFGATATINVYDGTIPTVEQQQLETTKGIWATLKDIPNLISDKLRSLFVPSDGYFTAYVQELQNYFQNRFGFLYELPSSVVTILQQLVDYSPASSGYSIHFPSVSTPYILNSSIAWHEIITDRDITFEFLDRAPFSTLYSGYRAFVWLAYCVALINLAIRKFDSIFGGGGG